MPRREYNPSSFRSVFGLLAPTPRAIIDTYSPAMARQIREALERDRPDLVIASEWFTAAYQSCWRQVPSIFEDLEPSMFAAKSVQAGNWVLRGRHQLTMLKLGGYLGRLLPRFGACTVVSEAERALLRRLVPHYGSVEVIPNAVSHNDYRGWQETPKPNTLVFTGSFRYVANYEAMVWFTREVLPLVRAQVPEARLTITGDHGNLALPDQEGVILTGLVPNVQPVIASSWVSVAPIWQGGGTRLKILEAMALRTPVVATSKGAEGLDVQHGEQILLADTAESFANEVICLLRQPALRRRLADSAHQLIRDKYDWDVVMPRFLQLAERVARG